MLKDIPFQATRYWYKKIIRKAYRRQVAVEEESAVINMPTSPQQAAPRPRSNRTPSWSTNDWNIPTVEQWQAIPGHDQVKQPTILFDFEGNEITRSELQLMDERAKQKILWKYLDARPVSTLSGPQPSDADLEMHGVLNPAKLAQKEGRRPSPLSTLCYGSTEFVSFDIACQLCDSGVAKCKECERYHLWNDQREVEAWSNIPACFACSILMLAGRLCDTKLRGPAQQRQSNIPMMSAADLGIHPRHLRPI